MRPSSTGKSHNLEAHGDAAISDDAHVSPGSAPAPSAPSCVVNAPTTQKSGAIQKTTRAHVIVIDDVSLLLVAAETAEALYRIVDSIRRTQATAGKGVMPLTS